MTSSPTSESKTLRQGRLWFGLLGGIVAWTVHLMGVYTIAEFGCRSNAGSQIFLGLTTVTWLVLGLSVVTLAVAAGATVVARNAGRELRDDERSESRAGRHVADAGLYLSGLSVLVIVVETIPIFYDMGC